MAWESRGAHYLFLLLAIMLSANSKPFVAGGVRCSACTWWCPCYRPLKASWAQRLEAQCSPSNAGTMRQFVVKASRCWRDSAKKVCYTTLLLKSLLCNIWTCFETKSTEKQVHVWKHCGYECLNRHPLLLRSLWHIQWWGPSHHLLPFCLSALCLNNVITTEGDDWTDWAPASHVKPTQVNPMTGQVQSDMMKYPQPSGTLLLTASSSLTYIGKYRSIPPTAEHLPDLSTTPLHVPSILPTVPNHFT